MGRGVSQKPRGFKKVTKVDVHGHTAAENPPWSFVRGIFCDLRYLAVQSQLGTVLQNTMKTSLGRFFTSKASFSGEKNKIMLQYNGIM